MKKTILLLACLVLSMTGCSEKINTAEVALLTEKEIIKQYTADGTISSESENVSVTVGFSDVRVSEVSVSIGDIVKKGDKICEFDSTGVRAEIDELTDSIDVDSKKREADLNYYKSAIEYAETSRTNVINLFTEEISQKESEINSTENEYNNKLAEYDTLLNSGDEQSVLETAQLKIEADELYAQLQELRYSLEILKIDYDKELLEADKNVSQAKHDLEVYELENDSDDTEKLEALKKQLNEMTVYAPCDGYINSINVLKAQHFSGGAIAEIAVESKNKIIVSVPDEYILKIAEGDNVSYSTSFSDSEFTGVVEDVSAIKNGQGYDVTISSDKADDFLSGMQVSVSFTTENVTDMAVPSTSVLKDEKDEYYILVVKANGNMVEKCNIECGISGNNYTQLLSGTPTIQTGDMVILEPSLYYSGMTVEPVIQEEAEK